MPLWKNTDDAANSVISAPGQLKQAANSANRDALFGNTTGDAYFTGATHGVYGVSAGEAQAGRAGAGDKVTHAGWVLRTEGSGGRAGRVQHETLVAMKTITGDAEDVLFEDYALSFTTQPSDATANSGDSETATFTIVAASVPAGASITYRWQESANGSVFVDINNGGQYAGATTASLEVTPANTDIDGYFYRCRAMATGADNVVSTAVTLTVTE